MLNLELKKYSNQNLKTQWMSLIAEWRGQRFSEHKDGTIEITQFEQKRENRLGREIR